MNCVKANTLRQVSDLLIQEAGSANILAGGTDVLVQNRPGLVEPELVINIKFIEGMRTIEEEDGSYQIGAAVSGAELGKYPRVLGAWPGVVEGMELVGSTQIQGRATLAGNLCHCTGYNKIIRGIQMAAAELSDI
ncbi:MAG: FAD binding domain-containing protein [Paracoccaceae bacterium]|nr:FAD binding domain-containing protein [Paracoccaceae bacterium]